MSLDSLFKQNNKKKNEDEIADHVSGEFRSRAEEDSLAAESADRSKSTKTSKRAGKSGNQRKHASDDIALPEKKRARRRLIGAVALVLAAVIGLPMLFDSEPQQTTPKIAIEIPSKDSVQITPNAASGNKGTTAPALTQGADLSQGIDKSEEIVQVNPTNAQPAKQSEKTVATPILANPPHSVKDERTVVNASDAKVVIKIPEKNLDKKNETTVASNQASPSLKNTPEPNKKTEVKAEPKAEAKKETIDDAARALALLEGRSLPEESNKKTVKANPAGSFVVQVAALNTSAKVKELQAKLKSANIASYTQKIITQNGEVIRIRVGPFANKNEAEKMRVKLVKIGLSGTLIPN